jgi:hypothetical protein
MSDDGTGKVFCSNATPSACEVVMTAIHKQTSQEATTTKDETAKGQTNPEECALLVSDGGELCDTEFRWVWSIAQVMVVDESWWWIQPCGPLV